MSTPGSILVPGWTRADRVRGLWRATCAPLSMLLTSAWLLRVAVPPHPVAPAAWVALVPLIMVLRGRLPGAGER